MLLLKNGADLKNLTAEPRNRSDQAFEYYTNLSNGEQAVWDPTLDNSTLAFAKGKLAEAKHPETLLELVG